MVLGNFLITNFKVISFQCSAVQCSTVWSGAGAGKLIIMEFSFSATKLQTLNGSSLVRVDVDRQNTSVLEL